MASDIGNIVNEIIANHLTRVAALYIANHLVITKARAIARRTMINPDYYPLSMTESEINWRCFRKRVFKPGTFFCAAAATAIEYGLYHYVTNP